MDESKDVAFRFARACGAYWEWAYPVVFAVGVLAASLRFSDEASQTALSLPSPMLTLLAMMVGFTATAVTVLFASPALPQLSDLKGTPTISKLIAFYDWVIVAGIAASLLSLVVAAIANPLADDRGFGCPWQRVVLAVWLAMSSAVVLCFYRSTSLLIVLFKRHWVGP